MLKPGKPQTADMIYALRQLEQARWRVGHETAVWGAPAREAIRRLDASLARVRWLELNEAAA